MSKQNLKKNTKEIETFHALCMELFFPPIDLAKYQIPEIILDYIPERIAIAYQIVPISQMGNVLTVAMSDPLNISTIDSLKLLTQMDISPVIALQSQIAATIEIVYSLRSDSANKEKIPVENDEVVTTNISSFQEEKFSLEEVTRLSKGTKIVNAVNKMLSDAVKMRASDIHIEPAENNIRVRFRTDGIMYEAKVMDKHFQEAVVARIKIMSRLDITQRRISQDGRFGFNLQNKQIDVRVSILPMDFGEKVVMRLLDKESIQLSIEKLGFSPYALDIFKQAISKPLGMILLTGPTGSGKTTTLYTLLNKLNTLDRSLVTIEDPVEYNLPGITQIPVKHEIGLDFATILRATLRQSPDIIMVGEIRDFETVDIAMKASLTGHIVFSTLHTNDAPSAITRLLNMNVEPFLISFSLNMIAAQRLVRQICPKCKISYKEDLSNNKEILLRYRQKNVILYKGKGCKECGDTGYRGRIAVVEALSLDETIRDMIIAQASTEEIREYAKKNLGMKTLNEDAIEKALRGETTLDEVIRVTTEF